MGIHTPAHPGVSVPSPQPGMLPPSPLVEAAVGRLSATTAAKSSSLSALAEAGSRGPARPPWAAGGPQQSKKGRRCPALNSRSSLRRGVRGRRRPDTPKPPSPPGRPGPPRSGSAGSPGSAGPAGGTPNGAPEASVPAGICLCSPRSAGGGRDAMRPPLRSYLGEPCCDGNSEMLNFIHRIQENVRDRAQGSWGLRCSVEQRL
ncbi:hypothetical protein Nmel_011906 [Mimus melanotis]